MQRVGAAGHSTTPTLRRTGRRLWGLLRVVGAVLGWQARWAVRHWRWFPTWLFLAGVGALWRGDDLSPWAPAAGLAPMVLACGWAMAHPVSYERLAAGPYRRWRWRRWIRREWSSLCEACGWARRTVVGSEKGRGGSVHDVYGLVVPRLVRVRARGSVLAVTVRARRGQTLDELEAGAPRLAASADAVSHRAVAKPGSTSTLRVELVMGDQITTPATATMPPLCDPATGAARAPGVGLRMGRTQTGADWELTVAGRHTLVSGCSGAGKGSILWGVVCGLAPWVPSDTIRLWGIDLKHGVEIMMGRALFAGYADTHHDALAVLDGLLAVIEARGAVMAGRAREHTARPGDPLHVLVIDELADLIAYSDPEVRREAARLLAKVLTKGRALGVVVLACVQDPRKDVVTMRNLFTQRVALRLLTAEETHMVLGDGAGVLAPAHRISHQHRGMAWIVDDEGNADRVRADYWPDSLIRQVAATYPSGVHVSLDRVVAPEGPVTTTALLRPVADAEPAERSAGGLSSPRAPRKPRAPRPPRGPRTSRAAGEAAGVVDGSVDGVA